MRAVSANLLALLLFCTCACVFYVWNSLEVSRLERYTRGLQSASWGTLHPGPPSDLPVKTFRALLTVPAAQRLHFGDGRQYVHNLTGVRDQTGSLGSRDYHINVDNKESAQKGVPESNFVSLVEEGIFWSEWLEDRLPVSFSEKHARAWRERARGQRIVKLEPGCGRISNQLATFLDGTKACVRYGINADQVQGETLTYYLAGLLGITNIPPLILSQLNVDSEQWDYVRRKIFSLQWSERAVVSLTEWVANLTGVVTPEPLRQKSKGLLPLPGELRNQTTEELVELMQWTDLIILDYLSANFDRLVSNLFSLQWDSRVMERETNNLLRTPRGNLVFIDNEAGLVHGFRVLDMWEKYHSTILGSVCVFRKRTAQRVIELHRRRDTRTRLLELYRDSEPLSPELGFFSDEHAGVLQTRIDRVYKHITHCKGMYHQL
ncbi:four-jointed box protein 1 [Esox lucius]|uniref:Four-jointed box kinase 1 n=1 Tax=Esox lucius TaxID=8010 RepID=A0AAY5LCA9_ESOLU|nr:four-jointed box protein 1 [Esox lucius]